jgi:serine/threonine protein kinase
VDRIGGYLVERKLGEGGMGTVYLARSRGGRAVAVKVARPELAVDPAFRARFSAEVDAARKVGGFHTAPVVDADPDGHPPWLATAYVPGPTLAGLVTGQGPLDEAALRRLGAALAEALGAIHACGLVHRDFKPGNIIMADDGPRVLDFGIARAAESTRLTVTGAAFGTPGYLAPEQAMGEQVTPATDVFALGAVLVAAAGGKAFGDGTPVSLMYRSVHESADLSRVPEGIRALVAACLAKDPAERPSTERLLDWLVPEQATSATPPPPVLPPSLPPPSSRTASLPAPSVPPSPPSSVPPPPSSPPRQDLGDRVRDFRDLPQDSVRTPPAEQDAVTTLFVRRSPPPQGLPLIPQDTVAADAFGRSPTEPSPPVPEDVVLADRECAVVVNGEGVLFAVDEAEAEFPWNEIDRVAHTVNRRRNRLTVEVVLTDGHSYHCTVSVKSRGMDERLAALDALLGGFFTRAAGEGTC